MKNAKCWTFSKVIFGAFIAVLTFLTSCTPGAINQGSTNGSNNTMSSSGSDQSRIQTKSESRNARIEPLKGFKLVSEGIEFAVVSNGCTQLTDFLIETEVDADACKLTIYRTKPDRCRRTPNIVEFSMNWDSMNLEFSAKCSPSSVRLMNPVDSSSTLPARQKAKSVYK